MKVYLASGWFSPEQMKACKDVEESLSFLNDSNFFPRSMNLGTDGCSWNEIFSENIYHLDECDVVVASTVGKDMGTLWECGYAYAKGKRIVYYTPGIKKPNLMLGLSGQIATTIEEMKQCVLDSRTSFSSQDFE